MKSKTELLNDLHQVGPAKPVGYLPLDTIENDCGANVAELQQLCEIKGLKTAIFSHKECETYSGALFVWHEAALQAMLEPQKLMLAAAGIKADCEDYIRKIAAKTYTSDPLYGFIAETFGQPFRKAPAGKYAKKVKLGGF